MNLKEFRALSRLIEKEAPETIKLEEDSHYRSIFTVIRECSDESPQQTGGITTRCAVLTNGGTETVISLVSDEFTIGKRGQKTLKDKAHFKIRKTTKEESRMEIE